jgi:hypothetical protein
MVTTPDCAREQADRQRHCAQREQRFLERQAWIEAVQRRRDLNATRRLDRRRQREECDKAMAEEAVRRIRDEGFTLHRTFRPRSVVYWLGGDHRDAYAISESVATLVICRPQVIALDGGLFDDAPTPQLWRWAGL